MPTYASAGDLAHVTLSLCTLAVRFRAEGWCLGDLEARDLRVRARTCEMLPILPGIRGMVQRSDRLRRRYRHVHVGHSGGCWALGLPLETARAITETWDGSGAAPLLLDGLRAAVREIETRCNHGYPWSAKEALEAVTVTVERRVTPRSAPVEL